MNGNTRITIPLKQFEGRSFDVYPMEEAVIPPGGRMELTLDLTGDNISETGWGTIYDKNGQQVNEIRLHIVEIKHGQSS